MTDTPESASTSANLRRTVFGFGWSFFKHSLIALFTIAVVSIPAGLVIRVAYPETFRLLILAVFSCGVHLAAMYVRSNHGELHDSFDEEKGDLQEAAVLMSGMVTYFTPVMLLTTLVAGQLGDFSNSASVALLFALYYPVLDFKTITRFEKSPGGVPLILFFYGLHRIDIIDVPALEDIIDDLLYKPTTLDEAIDDLLYKLTRMLSV